MNCLVFMSPTQHIALYVKSCYAMVNLYVEFLASSRLVRIKIFTKLSVLVLTYKSCSIRNFLRQEL